MTQLWWCYLEQGKGGPEGKFNAQSPKTASVCGSWLVEYYAALNGSAATGTNGLTALLMGKPRFSQNPSLGSLHMARTCPQLLLCSLCCLAFLQWV